MREGLSIELVATPKVSFALEQCAIPIVRSVSIRNRTANAIAHGLFTVQLVPDLGDPVRQGLPLVEPGGVVDLGAIDLRLPPANAAHSQLIPVAYLGRDAFELLVHADNSTPDTAFGPFLDHTGGRAVVRRWDHIGHAGRRMTGGIISRPEIDRAREAAVGYGDARD